MPREKFGSQQSGFWCCGSPKPWSSEQGFDWTSENVDLSDLSGWEGPSFTDHLLTMVNSYVFLQTVGLKSGRFLPFSRTPAFKTKSQVVSRSHRSVGISSI